jgi:exosome complex RNA-binding protein Rrp42 (RNase PH superfamily)
LDALCIEEGRAVWECRCVLHVLEHDGNLADACLLAMTGALADTRLPTVQLGDGEGNPHLSVTNPAMVPLALGLRIFGVTFGILSGHLLVDPTAEEEALLSTCFTVLLDADGSFHGLHKAGGAPLAHDVMQQSLGIAQQQLARLNMLLPSPLSGDVPAGGKRR